MNRANLSRLTNELNELIGHGPGKNEDAMRRVKAIARDFERASAHMSVREKVQTLTRDFEIWFSPRRWNRFGPEGKRLRPQLYTDVRALSRAMTTFGDTKA